ncbi:SDR family NAD(P)-dependent oxidoreductase [Acuticoccus kandeliae]|uniref:SDR family NAD(P)-dependent oxidoreductase n=1 Tax=Acuticoccus kandeliae TaxID=2073160 RepID=UPI000D3E0408|nr:SDR family oxidoreductase [Acuticoccus kandeliae]
MQNKLSLEGANILLTGAGGGIGTATARALAAAGAHLILVDFRDIGALAESLSAEGASVETHICDVTDRAAVEALCAEVGPRVQAAVLNAGSNPFNDWMAPDFDKAFADLMAVNILGPINFARALIPPMQANQYGRLVVLGSVAGFNGGSIAAVPPDYVISKGGVHTMVRWLAKVAGEFVTVNAVAPGVVDTAMTAGSTFTPPASQPIKRKATPEEIAWPIAFLCSPGASYITGAVIDVNGGLVFR